MGKATRAENMEGQNSASARSRAVASPEAWTDFLSSTGGVLNMIEFETWLAKQEKIYDRTLKRLIKAQQYEKARQVIVQALQTIGEDLFDEQSLQEQDLQWCCQQTSAFTSIVYHARQCAISHQLVAADA